MNLKSIYFVSDLTKILMEICKRFSIGSCSHIHALRGMYIWKGKEEECGWKGNYRKRVESVTFHQNGCQHPREISRVVINHRKITASVAREKRWKTSLAPLTFLSARETAFYDEIFTFYFSSFSFLPYTFSNLLLFFSFFPFLASTN